MLTRVNVDVKGTGNGSNCKTQGYEERNRFGVMKALCEICVLGRERPRTYISRDPCDLVSCDILPILLPLTNARVIQQ